MKISSEITPAVLLDLGFTQDPGYSSWYCYEGFYGFLHRTTKSFSFCGFTNPIDSIDDLKFMIMLIDYNQEGFVAYQSCDN